MRSPTTSAGSPCLPSPAALHRYDAPAALPSLGLLVRRSVTPTLSRARTLFFFVCFSKTPSLPQGYVTISVVFISHSTIAVWCRRRSPRQRLLEELQTTGYFYRPSSPVMDNCDGLCFPTVKIRSNIRVFTKVNIRRLIIILILRNTPTRTWVWLPLLLADDLWILTHLQRTRRRWIPRLFGSKFFL